MKLDIQDFRNKFYNEIKSIIESEGYVFKKSKYDFIKIDQDWEFRINVYCHKWNSTVEITTKAYLGNSFIDKVRNKAIGEKYHQNFIFGGDIKQLCEFKGEEWKKQFSSILVTSDNELDEIVREWKEEYKKYIVNFYNTVSSLSFIEAWYNNEKQLGLNVHAYLRALNRPIIMYLLNKPKKNILAACENDIYDLKKFLTDKELERLEKMKKFIIDS